MASFSEEFKELLTKKRQITVEDFIKRFEAFVMDASNGIKKGNKIIFSYNLKQFSGCIDFSFFTVLKTNLEKLNFTESEYSDKYLIPGEFRFLKEVVRPGHACNSFCVGCPTNFERVNHTDAGATLLQLCIVQ